MLKSIVSVNAFLGTVRAIRPSGLTREPPSDPICFVILSPLGVPTSVAAKTIPAPPDSFLIGVQPEATTAETKRTVSFVRLADPIGVWKNIGPPDPVAIYRSIVIVSQLVLT